MTELSRQEQMLVQYMAQHLPVAVAMQVKVRAWDGCQLCLCAPLASNFNDKGTAFGGSLIALATLSCWGVCWLGLLRDGIQADLVLAQQSSRFLRPVWSELRAIAVSLPKAQWQEKLAQFNRQGQADLTVESQIRTLNRAGETKVAVLYQAVFRLRSMPD